MDITPFLDLRPAPLAVFERAATTPDKPRFYCPDGDGWAPVTWREFAEDIARVASGLRTLGLRPGERAAIYAPNRLEWASAALGIQAAGGVMVPIYPSSTADQTGYVVDHSDARVLFVDTGVLLDRVVAAQDQLGKLDAVVLLDDDLDARRAEAALSCRILRWSELLNLAPADVEATAEALRRTDLDSGAMMLYTSGTSGRPKGVPLTHRNVGVNGRDWLECNAPLMHDDAVDVLWLPLSHIFGFGELCLGNTLGFTTWWSSPMQLFPHLREVRPTVLMSVPSVWEKLAQQAQASGEPHRRLAELTGGRLKFCLSGGAGLKREVKELFRECDLLIIEGYGLTEASPTLTLNRPDAFRFDAVGKPLPSVELKLANDGEILARGESIFSGYHKDDEATREAFTDDGWLKTGDIGRWTDDGFLQIIDRKKDILVTAGGKNVAPANIEVRFATDALIDHLVVYGDGHKYLVAGVWVNPALAKALGEGVEAAVAERIEAVNGELARHETLKKFALMSPPLTVEGGLLTPTLKVKRKAVYAAYRDQFEALYR